MPISEAKKTQAKNDAYMALQEISKLSSDQKIELGKSISKAATPEGFSLGEILSELNLFKVGDANAAAPIPVAIATCMSNPACAAALATLTGATVSAVANAFKKTSELFKYKGAESENQGAKIFSTPEHKDEGLTLKTPGADQKVDKETFPAEDQAHRPIPGFESPGYNAKIPGFDSHEGNGADILLKDLPDTVNKVGKNYPRNAQYAGKVYPIEKLSPELQAKYPDSVRFKETGYPDYTPYSIKEVQVEGLTGVYGNDEGKSNKAAGFKITPKGYTWHHVEDGKTMQCVPKDIHAISHTGGAAAIKHGVNKQ